MLGSVHLIKQTSGRCTSYYLRCSDEKIAKMVTILAANTGCKVAPALMWNSPTFLEIEKQPAFNGSLPDALGNYIPKIWGNQMIEYSSATA